MEIKSQIFTILLLLSSECPHKTSQERVEIIGCLEQSSYQSPYSCEQSVDGKMETKWIAYPNDEIRYIKILFAKYYTVTRLRITVNTPNCNTAGYLKLIEVNRWFIKPPSSNLH